MNKPELIKVVSDKVDETQKRVKEIYEAIFDTIVEEVVAGEEVSIPGVGKFMTVDRAAREGVNPSTGERITIEASKSPKFKASKTFKDAVKKTV